MAIRKEETANGRIVLRHDSGTHAGELAGSLSTKALAGVESLAQIAPPALASLPNATESQPALDRIYSRFASMTSASGEQVAIPDFSHQSIIPAPAGSRVERTPAVWLSYQLAADVDGKNVLTPEQLENIFEMNARNMKVGDLAKGVTEQQWRDYLALSRAKITDPNNGMSETRRAEMLGLWQSASEGSIPSPEQFAAMNEVGKRVWRARKSLEWNADQIAAWHDVSTEKVLQQVDAFVNEYRTRTANGENIDVSEATKGWSFYAKTAPKDAATVYAFHKADNPTLYPDKDSSGIRYVALDLETTGRSAKDNEIIEIGIVEYDAHGNELSRWGQLICPPADETGAISTGPEDAVAVHGIQPQDVIGKPGFAEVLPEIQQRLQGAIMIGHNIQFDSTFLKSSMRRHAPVDIPEMREPSWSKEADTMIHAYRHLGDLGLENRKLKTIATHFGVTYDNGHRAEHDAQVAGEVFFKLRARLLAKHS